jgi:uncharacterized protein YuzE
MLRVRFAWRERLSHTRQLDFHRSLDIDQDGEVVGVTFLAASSHGIDLEGVPHADEIAEAIRAFRAATAQFAPASVKG